MINSIVMEGRMCNDCEIRSTQAGTSIASFRIACNDSRKDKDGNYPTVFMQCTLFGKSAEGFAKYAVKGKLVSVVGRLTQRKYTNKSGQEVTSTEIMCDRAEFGNESKPADNPMTPRYEEPQRNNAVNFDLNGEELPF